MKSRTVRDHTWLQPLPRQLLLLHSK